MLPESRRTKVYSKLRKAWREGMPDIKAAQYAGITYAELKDLLMHDPRLELTRGALRGRSLDVELKARENLNRSIMEGSVESSLKYLERKVPEEFSTKSQVNVQGDFASIEDKKEELSKLMEKFGE